VTQQLDNKCSVEVGCLCLGSASGAAAALPVAALVGSPTFHVALNSAGVVQPNVFVEPKRLCFNNKILTFLFQ
jgi:hypothetical protein